MDLINTILSGARTVAAICVSVFQEMNERVFKELDEHFFDTPILESHLSILIKTITKSYIKIRFHHLARLEQEKITGPIIRKKLSKLIHFNHQ